VARGRGCLGEWVGGHNGTGEKGKVIYDAVFLNGMRMHLVTEQRG